MTTLKIHLSVCGKVDMSPCECRIHKGSPIIPILSRINPIPRIDTYLFKVYSNIVFPSTPRPPQRSLSCRCSPRIIIWNAECTVMLHFDEYHITLSNNLILEPYYSDLPLLWNSFPDVHIKTYMNLRLSIRIRRWSLLVQPVWACPMLRKTFLGILLAFLT